MDTRLHCLKESHLGCSRVIHTYITYIFQIPILSCYQNLCDILKGLLWGLVVLLSTCKGHSSLSCGTFKCIFSVGNSFKTYICWSLISCLTDTFQFLNQVAKSIEDLLRYHKISFDTPNTLVTRKCRFSKKSLLKCVARPHLSRVPLIKLSSIGCTFV